MRTLLVLFLLLLILGIALTLPVVQTALAKYVTDDLNKKFGTDINVEKVEINIFGNIQLKKVFIKDEKKDTLIFVDRLITSILDYNRLIDGKLIFGNITADGLNLNIKTYKGDKDSNLDKFVAAFDDGQKATGKFLMTSDKIIIKNSRFKEIDYNREVPLDVDFTNLNAVTTNFKIQGPNVTTDIEKMSFKDHRGLFIEDLKSKFTYTKKNIRLEKTELKTAESTFKGDIILKYERKDFADFNNKVIFDVNTEKASISSNDIRFFYNEIGKNQVFSLQGKIDGTLNNLYAKNLHLKDNRNSEIIGDVNFRNLFAKKGKGDFYMKGSFDKVSSSYDNLIVLLPNVLGKKLPSSLRKLGQFNLDGDAEITTKAIDAVFNLKTKLGNISSDLTMTNIDNIDNASYSGNIILDRFDLGTFLNRKELGITTLDVQVDGKGFTEKYLDTKFSGEVKNFKYNGYNYKSIIADGSFKKPIFKGKVNVNDPNLFLDFNGVVDLSKRENIYDFHAKVDYANLKKLNFLKDSLSVFKGDIVMKISGSNLNNMKGDVIITNASYQNPKDIYFFDDLVLNSKFNNDGTRKISLKSSEGIDGEIEGKFDINLIPKMVKNSMGSLYTNYKPDKIRQGQFLKFKFTEFDKILEIVNPDVTLSNDAVLEGSIDSDDNDFKMNFTSNSIDAFGTHLDNLLLEVDNKNPLYNTYVQLDSIKTKYYKVRDFSLINVTSKDTLNFRTEFKGGDKGNDFYNLNIFHTIDSNDKSVVGFKKSEMMFKDFLWNINEEENDKNKIVFDQDFKNFSFDNITISHENQLLKLNGLIDGKNNKDLELTFKDVDLNKITPDIKKFKFDGYVNGNVFLKQDNSIYQPTASIQIKDFLINENALGNLNLDIKGDESFKRFEIISNIENENFKSLDATGDLEIVNNETLIDLDLNFQKFNLGVLGNLGGDVLSNIRGSVSGDARLNGNIKQINYYGKLFVDDAGLTVPYINTDYKIQQNSIIEVTTDKFIIKPTTITDSLYNTSGNLSGYIKHKQFGDWFLDLNINSKKILALNTKDHDDAAYFGTAFINGDASIKGPIDGLVINVSAESEKGTDIKIPINDAESVSESDYIHFKTYNEKYNIKTNTPQKGRNYKGLEMNFDFEITPVANIEVILDRESGHGIKGNGVGTLGMSINTLGKFEMTGDFQVWKGTYRFRYGGLIDKTFDVKKYGSIVWEGDPYGAILDLEAIYNVIGGANPAVLVNNASFSKKVPVEVSIAIKGRIMNPEPSFNINFPTVSSVLKSEIENSLSDPSTKQTQALHLLSFGGFLSKDGLSNSQFSNFAFETASGMVSDLFGGKDDKLQVLFDYTKADRTPGIESDGRVGVTVSTKLNERITINGKVGVPVGGITETAIVGNFELEYRVNEDGTMNLRVFNRENDINYIGQGIGYTQGLGVSYQVDFDTFKELVNRIFTKSKIDRVDKKNKSNENINDFDDEEVKMKTEKNKNNKKNNDLKINQEATPNED